VYSCDDEEEDDDEDDDEADDMDSFICDGTIEEEAPSNEASDDEEPENDLAIYRYIPFIPHAHATLPAYGVLLCQRPRRSMLSQASVRPANFRTPKRQVPNKYKMRYVEHTPESPDLPAAPLRSWETSPSSSVASSPATTPSIKRGDVCMPPPPSLSTTSTRPTGRRLDFSTSIDNRQAEAEHEEEEDDDELELVAWPTRKSSASSKTAAPTTTPAPPAPSAPPVAETPNWTLDAYDEFEGLDMEMAFPQLPSTLDEVPLGEVGAKQTREETAEPDAKKARRSVVTIQIEETDDVVAIKREPDYGDIGHDDAVNWSQNDSSGGAALFLAYDAETPALAEASGDQERKPMSLPPSPYLAPSTGNKKRSLTSLSVSPTLSSSPQSSIMSPPSSPGTAFLTPPAMGAPAPVSPAARSPLRRGMSLSALSATSSSPALTPQSPFALDINSPSRLPAHLLTRIPTTPEQRRARKKTPPTIIISSMQLNRSQIPQILRNKWKAPTIVYSLPPPGDFLVSCRNGGTPSHARRAGTLIAWRCVLSDGRCVRGRMRLQVWR
jgi:hypothetical protein